VEARMVPPISKYKIDIFSIFLVKLEKINFDLT
jgi:hypothetical protein